MEQLEPEQKDVEMTGRRIQQVLAAGDPRMRSIGESYAIHDYYVSKDVEGVLHDYGLTVLDANIVVPLSLKLEEPPRGQT